MSEIAPEIEVLCETRCCLGEGPTYDPATDTAIWFDIISKKMIEMPMESREPVIHELPFMASATGIVDEKSQLVLAENGLYVRDRKSGILNLHCALERENSVTRSNDARVHQSGSFWISTMGKEAEHQAGAIYIYRCGEITKLFDKITIPNAICFSPEGDVAYFCDTMKAQLMKVQVDPASGLPINEPVVYYDHSKGLGGLDGAVVDSIGNLWNARWGASSLDTYDAYGDRITTFHLPVSQPTCPAFVGRDADKVLVTSAFEGMDKTARLAEPSAGKTLLLNIGTKGRHEPCVVL